MRQHHREQWGQGFRQFWHHHWIPLLLVIIGIVTLLGLWQHVLIHQQLELQHLIQQTPDGQGAALDLIIPTIALWIGLAGVWALTLVVHLAQRSIRQVQQTQSINPQDITKHKQSEIALQESEAKYRNLIEHLNAGFVVHAPDTQIVQCNATACNLLSLSMDQMLGKVAIDPTWHFVREDGTVMPVEEYPINRVLATWLPLENYIVGIHRGNQLYTWARVTAFPEFDATNQLKQVVVTFIDISQLKQAETKLEKELLRSKTLLNTSRDGIVVMNNQGDVVQVSPSFAQMLGYTVEETLTLNVADWELQWTREELRQMMAGNAIPPLFETWHHRKDGSRYDAEISHSQVELEGEMMHFTICRDISERKRAEAALRQSETTKQAIIQAIPDVLMRMDADGTHVEFISDSPFNLVNPTQFSLSNSVYDVLPLPLAELCMHYVQQALQSATAQVYEEEVFIQGTQRYEEVRIVPLLQDAVLVMVRDITERSRLAIERQQVEENLRHQKEMFQAIVDHIPVMISLFNKNGHIEFVNPELEKVLGWSFANWQQPDILTRCYPDKAYRQSVVEHMLAATGNWRDFQTLTAQGQLLETSWANVQLSNGYCLGIGQDISERKHRETALQQAMEAAEAANLAKSMFLANMSHELRTPLNVILGFTQLMAHDLSLTTSQQEDLRTIQRSGDHLLNLINDVLDLSKIETGHCDLDMTSFDLLSLLHTLRIMMTERATVKQLQLVFDIAPNVPQFVIADEQKLRQILLNLLSNAIKFTQRGQVSLCVSVIQRSRLSDQQSTLLQFQIADTGVGISPAEQATIFDAFTQAEAGRKSGSGTGLGLTISRKLLKLMEGTIAVQSTPNQGSTFTCTIPVHLTNCAVPPQQPQCTVVGLMPGQPQHRILVVDDQVENRLLIVRLLTHIGMDVREAAHGQEAISLWQEWQPDLIWMDIRMPGVDGYEATRQIRAMEQGQASVIIALTAQAAESDRTLALAAGCNDYISKPFQQQTIFRKMAEYLSLEYLYAEPGVCPNPASTTVFSMEQGISSLLDPAMVAHLPGDWFQALENAVICGNDWEITELAAQLPSDLAPLSHYLTDLVDKFQFEQILNWVHAVCQEGA